MTQLIEVSEQLTEDERRRVQAFAQELLARRAAPAAEAPQIDVDRLYGMFAGLGGDRPDKELLRQAWDEHLAKHDH